MKIRTKYIQYQSIITITLLYSTINGKFLHKKIALHSVYTENSAIFATYIDSVKVGSEIITAAAYQYIPPQFTNLAREGARTAIPAATLSRASSDNSTLAELAASFFSISITA